MIRSALRNLVSGPFAVQMRRFVIVGAFTAGIQMSCCGCSSIWPG